ncbi:MAG: hypothetical protein AABZ53_02570 [Planctomycetota bacterium]
MSSLIFAALVLAGLLACQPASTPPPAEPAGTAQAGKAAEPVKVPPQVKVGEFSSAEELLGALETADLGLDQLQADISYDRTFDLEGERQIRQGAMYFQILRPKPAQGAADKPGEVVARATKRFAVRFDSLIVGRTKREETRIHVFDGTVFADKFPGDKRMTRRQIVGPGESFDPLKLGEGPLPIPIGQSKDEILRRYEAHLLPAEADLTDDTLKKFTAGSVQLRLVPREAFKQTDDFKEIRIWYRGKSPAKMAKDDSPSERLLPRMARTKNRNGDVSIVQLINVKVNSDAKIDASIISTEAEPGWQVSDSGFHQALPAKPAPIPEAPKPVEAPANPPVDPKSPGTTDR